MAGRGRGPRGRGVGPPFSEGYFSMAILFRRKYFVFVGERG
jgi:hypothetical protein